MNWKIYVLIAIGVLLFTQAYAFQGHGTKYANFTNEHKSNYTNNTNHNFTIKPKANYTNNTNHNLISHAWMKMRHYQRFKNGLHLALDTREKFMLKYKIWQRERQNCMAGNCSRYFNVTKDMTITAIDVTILRLQNINSTESQELITNLTTLKAEVENTSNIQDLRVIYPEVRKDIAKANHLFASHMLVNLAYAYLDYVNEMSQNTDNIKLQLHQLIDNSSNMTPSEIAHQLKIIRGEIMALRR